MIDNVINIVECSKNKTSKEVAKKRSEPLGFLPEIEGLLNLEGKKLDDLYEDVLIDTEVGFYFSKFLEEDISNSDNKTMATINTFLQEKNPETTKNLLKKIWFEHFYLYCQTLNPTTKEMMTDLLKFEADCQAIQIVYNSLAFKSDNYQEGERKKVIPNFGFLYPEVTEKLLKATSLDMLKDALR